MSRHYDSRVFGLIRWATSQCWVKTKRAGPTLCYLPVWLWTQQTRDIQPTLPWCWPIVYGRRYYDANPTSKQHWANVPCFVCWGSGADIQGLTRLVSRKWAFISSGPSSSSLVSISDYTWPFIYWRRGGYVWWESGNCSADFTTEKAAWPPATHGWNASVSRTSKTTIGHADSPQNCALTSTGFQ